jgi:hypothetical protein
MIQGRDLDFAVRSHPEFVAPLSQPYDWARTCSLFGAVIVHRVPLQAQEPMITLSTPEITDCHIELINNRFPTLDS